MTTLTSLPVMVRPRPGEFLVGLLLRADEANSLPAGTLATMVRRHDSGTGLYGRASLAVLATTFDLEAVADLLEIPDAAVEATTFRGELRRLFGPQVSSRRLGVTGALRVCPVCVRPPDRLIRRETVLPLMHGCTRHHIWLRSRCACGAALDAYSKGRPFTCLDCGRDWSELPRQPLGPRDDLRQRRVLHAYEVLLRAGRSGIIEDARRVLARDEGDRWAHGWCLADDAAITEQAIEARHIKSIAAIVANLVLREIPPERLLEQVAVGPHPGLVCGNRACPTFGSSTAIRVSAHRSNGIESYCAECGSRFLDGRTILSFDVDNGSPDLSPTSVRHARARLADYAMRLAEAAYFLSRYARGVEVDHVFHLAGVPLASHLRARRLGLVALVGRRLGRALRGYGHGCEPGLVDPAFADRWTFPGARLGWIGVYAGPDAMGDASDSPRVSRKSLRRAAPPRDARGRYTSRRKTCSQPRSEGDRPAAGWVAQSKMSKIRTSERS